MMSALYLASTRPYLIRALYEWCADQGLTPYIAVLADGHAQVPQEYVKDGEIVLNISMEAASGLKLGNEYIEFKARFAGRPRQIVVPMIKVLAIYARENGHGLAFPVGIDETPAPFAASADSACQITPIRPVVALHRADGDSACDPSPASARARAAPDSPEPSEPLESPEPPVTPPRRPSGGRPALKRVK